LSCYDAAFQTLEGQGGPMMKRLSVALAVTIATLHVPAHAIASAPLTPQQAAVMKVDEAYRLAKLMNDTDALSRLLAEDFYEMNQNGNARNKKEAIALWAYFKITSLTTDRAEPRVTGNTAVVRGEQTERNETGVDRMVFLRTYVKAGNGWQLLASMQFRNPK
jgi:hypothetical protein